MLRHDLTGPRVRARLDIDRPQSRVVDVLQGHRHYFGLAVDIDAAEELQPETGAEILALFGVAALLEHRLGAERIVEFAGRPGAGMQRARDELPERIEIGKY